MVSYIESVSISRQKTFFGSPHVLRLSCKPSNHPGKCQVFFGILGLKKNPNSSTFFMVFLSGPEMLCLDLLKAVGKKYHISSPNGGEFNDDYLYYFSLYTQNTDLSKTRPFCKKTVF